MPRAGRALRLAAQHDAARLCANCGHKDAHRELQPTMELQGGEIVTIEHPDYRPGHFHCSHEGCDCEVVK